MELNRVRQGALLLDKVDPNWYLKVDLAELDMSKCAYCIAGQLKVLPELTVLMGGPASAEDINKLFAISEYYSHAIEEYRAAALRLGLWEWDENEEDADENRMYFAISFGFDAEKNFGIENYDEKYGPYGSITERFKVLGELWVAEIKDRVNR